MHKVKDKIMGKKSKKVEETEVIHEGVSQEIEGQELAMSSEAYIDLKLGLLKMAQDLLQQNAAMTWEIEKKIPNEITTKQVIDDAQSLLDFVLS